MQTNKTKQMLQKKQIIFDFDGVMYAVTELQMQRIIDSAKLALKGFSDKGIMPNKKFLKYCWGVSIVQMSQLFVEKLNWTLDQANMFLYYEKNKDGFFPGGLAPGYHDLIDKFKQAGIGISVCSNRCTSSFYPLIDKLKIPAQDFEFIILGDTLHGGIRKPDKRVLDPILLKYNKEEVILVGDSIRSDFQTAVNTHIDFIGISSVLHSRNEFISKFKTHNNGNKFAVVKEFKDIGEIINTNLVYS